MNGEDLKKIRTDKGWTQVKLAEKLGYSRDYIQKLEAGRFPLTKFFIQKLKLKKIIKKFDKHGIIPY